MENKVLQKNLNQISSYDKNLSNSILSTNLNPNIKITTTKKDEYNLIYNNFLIHNDNGAIEEAKKIVQKIDDIENTNSIRIVYGLGLGYLADEIAKKIKVPIIIYEPNLDLLKFVLEIAQIDAIYQKNVFICSKKDKLKEYILKFSNSDTKMTITFLSSYKEMYEEDIKSVLDLIQKTQGNKTANKNTLLSKAPSCILQNIKNLKYIIKNPLINQLKDVYKGKTALILSSGASLNENLDVIKNNQNKFVIFAINSNARMLIEQGIKPDFIVSIESNYIIKQYENIDLSSYYLINEAFSNNSILKLKSKNSFSYISNTNFLNPWIKKSLNIVDNLETLGTVSYSAFESAILMGFNKIILCGQDLAYKDGACYAKGSQFDDLECIYDKTNEKYIIKAKDYDNFVKKHLVGNNLDLAKRIASEHLEFFNKNIYTVKSQDGKNIPTQSGYALFIQYFSDKAKKTKNIKLINASSGGAQIDGFENDRLDNIIKNLENIEKLDLSNYKPDFNLEKFNLLTEKMIEGLVELEVINNSLIDIINKSIKELKIKKIITNNIEKSIKKINENILKINNIKHIDFIGVMYSTIYLESFKNNDLEHFEKLLNQIKTAQQNIRTYKELFKDAINK